MSEEFKKEKEASANRLREIRLNMGMSQEYFAECLDLSLSAYKKIESTENGISVKIMRRLKNRFNVSADYLLYGEYKDLDKALDVVENCSEADKMKLYLRLTQYFVNDKKKVFAEWSEPTAEFAQSLRDILDVE